MFDNENFKSINQSLLLHPNFLFHKLEKFKVN